MQKLVEELIEPFLIKESALVGSGGVIAGAPDPKKVKKVRKQLDKDRKKDEQHKIKEFIGKPKMKKALNILVKKKVLPKSYATNISKLQHFLTNNPMVMTQLLRLLGENINENDKAQLMKLYTKAMKMMPHSPAQKKVRKQIDALRKKLKMNEDTSKIKKVIGIYGGRFQPFGPHHKKTYEWMKKKFDDVYITTSNIKKPPKHPMNFKEKVRHMTKMGIPSSKIVQERTPYVATNTMKKFDKETTAVVYAFGAKEGSRLTGGKYFKDYKKNKKSLEGFWKHGYVLTAPHVSMKAAGMEVSGTTMRKLLGSPEYAEDRERRFKKYFGYFDKSVFNMMIGKFKKLFEDFKLSNNLIEEFISEVDVNKIIKEGSSSINFGTDDGPPTFYKGFGDYKKESKKWVDSMAETYGWEVVNYILSKGAVNPDFDYTLKYNVVPAVAFGRKGTGEFGSRFGVKDPIGEYKDQLGNVLATVGWEVIKWMGITPDGKSYTGVEVETPIFPGVGAPIGKPASAENTERAAQEADKTSSGMPKLSTLKERINLDEEIKVLLGDDIKPDIIKSFIIRDSLNTKVWDGDKLKPEIRKKLLVIAKNFFKDLELEPNVKLQDITLTGSISNYNWSKFSDVDLHLRLDFKQIDDDENFVKNYVLAKKTIWNNKHDIKIYGFPVEVYVENLGDKHVASGLYSILKDKWIVVPKKKELQIDLDDIRSKAEGYLGSVPVLQKMMKDGKYDEVVEMVEKIQDKLKRMRSSGLERGGEFSVENLAFKALRRSPFIADIIQMKNDAYDKKMSMKERINLDEEVKLIIEDWWADMTPEEQSQYIKDHPKSKKAQDAKKTKPVVKTKPYSKEQAEEEVGEYFENDGAYEAMPGLAKDEDDLTQKIQDAPEEVLSDDDLKNMINSDAADVLKADNPMKHAYDKAMEYEKEWDYITKNIKSGKPQEAPIVVRDKNGKMWLLAGNTRLMAQTAHGNKIPIKVIEYDGDIKVPKEEIKEHLLLEGGAYGHMNHPFDDKNITFSDLKQIIINGLGGKLNREDGVTEKLDGQNLMVSWVNGKLVTARNKGQLKNFGATSMDVSGVASKFAGRGDIRDAFVFAMKDLNKSIGSLSDKQKEKVFGNGKRWMNLEVMYPRSANVIDYDKAQIVFHGTLEYDESGTAIGQPKDSARMLAGMIEQVNQHVQKHYAIGKPQFLTVPKVQDFGKKKKTYLSRLNKLQKEYRLKDNDTLSKYHQSFWEEFIYNASKQHKAKISNKVLINLTKRWAFFDKSYKINDIKKDLKDSPKFLDWVRSFDKNDHLKMVSQNMKPFETLFFEVGAEILKNISGYIAASPQKAVQKIRKGVISAIKAVRSGGDVKKIQTLKHQIEKLESIGGLSSIVPSEGIVFKYKGKTYKFTGAFAPVNQILGLLRF